MCGIAGIFRKGHREDDRAVVQAMLETMALRGPDGEGCVQEGGLTLGHKRLAIIDLSDAAAQPMESPSGRYLITFNGEIYNYRELAREHQIAPGSLRSSSDTEILLHVWERWGIDCLDKLAGQFAFAVYDRKEELLWLARDRFGEKPLFYHEQPGVFAFASTLAGVLRAPWISRDVSQDMLAEYLTMRYVVSPRTILRDVRKLQPGHFLKVDTAGCQTFRWWAPHFRPARSRRLRLSRSQAREEFGHRLVQAAKRCMVSDVPAALLLSNGIDSNGILAALNLAQVDCPSYTYRGSAEGSAASDSEVHIRFEETVRDLEAALGSLTEPIGDGGVVATFHLIRQARSKASVFLSGHGGDELLAGYRMSQDRFRLAAMNRLARIPLGAFDRMVATYTFGDEEPSLRRRAMVAARPSLAPEAARYLHQHPLPPADLEVLFGPEQPPGRYLGAVIRLYSECPEHATDLDRMQEVAVRTFLSEHTTTLTDSCSMAWSAESRLPYLDRDLVDLIFDLPRWMRVGRFPGLLNTKLILREWGKGKIPQETLMRGKSGFRFTNIRKLLKIQSGRLRALIMDSALLRRHLGGLEAWTNQDPEVYRRGREGTFWALLALSVWSDRAGVR